MAKIPLLITGKMKKELLAMRFTDTMIKYMRPKEAWEILEGRLTMVDYVISKSYELLGIDEDDECDIDIGELTIAELEDLLGINPFKKLLNDIDPN